MITKLTKLELFINSLFIKLLENTLEFQFVSATLHFLEDPENISYLTILKFSKESFSLIEKDLEELTPQIIALKESHKGFNAMLMMMIAETLSDYSYTFQDKDANIVQSSLIFLLAKELPLTCLKQLCEYICNKELTEVFSRPQIYGSSFIFSTLVHELLVKKLDELAFNCAFHFENKSLLFTRDIKGFTPIELAIDNNCERSLEYFLKLEKVNQIFNVPSEIAI